VPPVTYGQGHDRNAKKNRPVTLDEIESGFFIGR